MNLAGSNLRDALSAAYQLRCRVESVRRTGELCVSHAGIPGMRVRFNRRRKAPRALTTFLRRVAQSC